MYIKINGTKKEILIGNISLKNLLLQNGVESIEMVSVQLNGTFVAKDQLALTYVKENDEVDFLFFMGGGSF